MTPEIITFYSIILGLLVGSFLNVCIYRIPLGREEGPPEDLSPEGLEAEEVAEIEKAKTVETEKITVTFPPRSFCPECKEQLLWWHNIPFFSWLFLKGKCYFCKNKIPFQYPLVELLSAVACYYSFQLFDLPTGVIVYLFTTALIVSSFIDIKYYIIPNTITYSGMIIGIILGLVNHFFHIFSIPVTQGIASSLFGLLAGGGVLLFVSEVYLRLRNKVGLGMGDVKLLAMTGLIFGPRCALATIFLGSFAGSILGVGQILLSKDKVSKPLPFGPYLAFGTLLFLFGEQLIPGGIPIFQF